MDIAGKQCLLDNSLATNCNGTHGKPKLRKGQSTLSLSTSYSSRSKGKKSKKDNCDNSESIYEMDTNNVSEENLSPSPGSLPHPPKKRAILNQNDI